MSGLVSLNLKLVGAELWGREDDAPELTGWSLARVKGDGELTVAARANSALPWLDLERRIGRRWRLDGLELEFEGILGLVECKVLDDVQVEEVATRVRCTNQLLSCCLEIKDLPIDVNTLDAGVLDVESLGDWLRLRDHGRNRQSRRHSVVVQANLVRWYADRTTADRNTQRELHVWQSFHL